MTPAEIDAVRRRLRELRAAEEAAGNVPVQAEDLGPVASAADEDEAPFREMDQSIASSRNRARADTLARIATAERRLEEDPDGFGLCEKCEDEIPLKRLLLLPFARLCVACQSAAEGRGRPVRKKVTDYRD